MPKTDRSAPQFYRFLRELLAISCVFFIAFVIRYGYVSAFLGFFPHALQPANDAKVYWELGITIYQKGWLPADIIPFYQAPLYPYLLALLHHAGIHGVEEVIRLQVLLGVINVLLCYGLARFWLSRTAAIAAAWLYAACHLPLFFESKILATTAGAFLFLLFCIVFLFWLNDRKTCVLIVSALIFSLACACCPPFLFTLPFILIFLLVQQKSERKSFLLPAFVFTTAFLIGLLPIPLVNMVIGGDFVPISANSGVTLYMGNNPQAQGGLAPIAGLSNDIEKQYSGSIELASQLAGKPLKPSQASTFWIHKTMKWIAFHPFQFVVLELKKIMWSVYHTPPAVNYSFYFESEWIRGIVWLSLISWFALAAGIAAIPLLLIQKHPSTTFLLYLIGGYILLSLVYYASDRFLAAMMPIVSIVAVSFFTQLRNHANRRWFWATFAIAGCFAANPFLADNIIREIGMGWYNDGVSCEQRGNNEAARQSYERSLQYAPNFSSSLLNLGVLYARRNELDRSNQLFRQVLELEPNNHTARDNLIINLRRQGREKEVHELGKE
jgi:tetratricopeptide (TPR) repeat protein